MVNNNDYCIILAGGAGRRLWPVSRKSEPKQFIDFFGSGQTLLQQTFNRFAKILPTQHIYVSTFYEYVEMVKEQLPEIDALHILIEPVQLSTAPAVAWATFHIEQIDPEANIIVTPSDQFVSDNERFVQQLNCALEYVETHDELLAIGVKPTVANSNYGYIQKGENCGTDIFYHIKSFTEKPDPEFARMFVESGEFLWNTGLFMWRIPTMARKLEELMPEVACHWREETRVLSGEEEQQLLREYYPSSLRLSVDLVVLEKSSNICVMECDFGWADIGSWPGIYEKMRHDADGNASNAMQDVNFNSCSHNLVYLPQGMQAAIEGVNDLLIAVKDNMLVVCPKDDPTIIRRLLNETQLRAGEDFV